MAPFSQQNNVFSWLLHIVLQEAPTKFRVYFVGNFLEVGGGVTPEGTESEKRCEMKVSDTEYVTRV